MSDSWSSIIGGPGNDLQLSKFHLGFNPTGGEDDSTPTFSMPNPLAGVQGMKIDQAGSRHFGTGVNISNAVPIVFNFQQRFSKRFPRESSRIGMITFVERSGKSALLRLKIDFECACLPELNVYQYSNAGRKEYGQHANAEKLMNDFAFAGIQNAEIASYKQNWEINNNNMIIGRRARSIAVTRAYHKSGDKITDKVLHSVYLLAIRRKDMSNYDTANEKGSRKANPFNIKPHTHSSMKKLLKQKKRAREEDVSDSDEESPAPKRNRKDEETAQDIVVEDGNSKDEVGEQHQPELHKDLQYYWTFSIYVSESDAAPPPHLYIDDISTGCAKRIGFILQHSGDNRAIDNHIKKARHSLSGKYNTEHEKEYLKDCPLLPYVDLAVGL